MAYEHKDLTGSVFPNDKKTDSRHADFNGSAKIEGKEYWVNVWVNVQPNGKKKLNLKFVEKKPKEQQSSGYDPLEGSVAAHNINNLLDDDIPF